MSTPKALTLCLLALLILSGCAGMAESRESPRVTLVGIKMVSVEIFEQRYGLMLRIQNPNPDALVITGMSFKVEINDQDFASGVSDNGVTVEGFGEATLDVEVVSSLFDVVEQLRALEKRQGQPLVYRIHGKIRHAGSPFSIPFERKGRIGGPATEPAPDTTIHAT
ncbi:MAG: LEA type 2 family protein [Candidatus Sedimenticola sp. 20ELBAFRAG]